MEFVRSRFYLRQVEDIVDQGEQMMPGLVDIARVIAIAFEDIPTAMAPFQQIDSGLNRKHEGSGLGLPLTKSLVEMHGGYLDLQSKVGVGTTVTVRFPAERILPSPRDIKSVGETDRKAG